MKSALQITDEVLVASYKSGDMQAMGILYERYSTKVYYKCLSFAKDEELAYDLAQDALLRAFDKVGGFRGGSSFSTWLYSIVYNHCVDYARKVKRSQSVPASVFEVAATDWQTEMKLERQRLALESLLNELSADDRELLLAKYRDNKSIQDIVTQLNIGASAVKMRLKRAKEKVQALYAATAPDMSDFQFEIA